MEPEIGIAAKVAFLRSSQAYGEAGEAVDVIETHYSWVFRTRHLVYKLKKPVEGPGFDFTTLEARRRNARDEVRLNARFAPRDYQGVENLTLEQDGRLALGGAGPAVDYLVKMARLPDERMLDRRMKRRRCYHAEIEALGLYLARFYARAPPVPLSPRAYLDRFRKDCAVGMNEFERNFYPALAHKAAFITLRLRGLLVMRKADFRRRLASRRVVEGHGDLRPEHICLGFPPRMIDCLEFRRELRLIDPIDELCFLSLECARLGQPRIEAALFRHYRRRMRERPPPQLIRFYKSFRALVRARIAIRHMADKATANPGWPRLAAAYLATAATLLSPGKTPRSLLLRGETPYGENAL